MNVAFIVTGSGSFNAEFKSNPSSDMGNAFLNVNLMFGFFALLRQCMVASE
jgi:hypothetical protein